MDEITTTALDEAVKRLVGWHCADNGWPVHVLGLDDPDYDES